MSKHTMYAMVAAALALPGLALAESEPNNPIAQAEALAIGSDGTATVEGVIGNVSGAAVLDVDFFSFSGREGDVVTIDIDGGMGGGRSVDTELAVFGPTPSFALLRANGDAGVPLDPGSTHPFDSRITNFRLPATGSYVVGVSSFPRRFLNGGGTSTTSLSGANANGDYTLVISGVTPPLLQINIDIKPGDNTRPARINVKSQGKIPVALLGSSEFTVADVDVDTLTFGHSGDEDSLWKCNKPSDVNGDAYPDMMCHFENSQAGWDGYEDEAILKGELDDGRRFEGRDWLKVVPFKNQRAR